MTVWYCGCCWHLCYHLAHRFEEEAIIEAAHQFLFSIPILWLTGGRALLRAIGRGAEEIPNGQHFVAAGTC